MKAAPSGARNAQLPWHHLYQAALFETDHQMIALRIAEAEKAILVRMK